MSRMIWLARQKLERMGWPGALGIGLLLFSAAFCATAIPARVAKFNELQQELAALRANALLPGGGAGGAVASREERLRSFYEFFPPMSTLPDWLERIYGAAGKNGVALENGEYKLTGERDSKLARYQLTFPIKASYAQVRGFVAQVLNEVPAAAIEEVAFKREAIGSTLLEARVRLTIYLGREP